MGLVKFAIKYKLSIFAIALLFFLSLGEADLFDNDIALFQLENMDKIIHTIMYFGVTSALYVDLIDKPRKKAFIIIVSTVTVLAFLTEAGQELFTQTRSGDIFDFCCNLLGSVLALILAKYTSNLYFKTINHVRNIFKR